MLFCNLNCFSQEGYNPIYVSLDKIGCISTKKVKYGCNLKFLSLQIVFFHRFK